MLAIRVQAGGQADRIAELQAKCTGGQGLWCRPQHTVHAGVVCQLQQTHRLPMGALGIETEQCWPKQRVNRSSAPSTPQTPCHQKQEKSTTRKEKSRVGKEGVRTLKKQGA